MPPGQESSPMLSAALPERFNAATVFVDVHLS